MSNNKQIEKPLELPHQETIVGTNTIQTKPFDNQKTMNNNKQQTALSFFLMGLIDLEIGKGISTDKAIELHYLFDKAKEMEKQQAEHYATFITNCVINNLPTITFNDWINLHNYER
jgi:general stress protein 26